MSVSGVNIPAGATNAGATTIGATGAIGVTMGIGAIATTGANPK